jgi:hypothetical protein
MEDFACAWTLSYSVLNPQLFRSEHSVIQVWTQLFCSDRSVILFWTLHYSALNAQLFWSQLSYSVLIPQLFWSQLSYFVLSPGVHCIPLVLLLVWQHRPHGRQLPWARAPCDGEVGHDGGVMNCRAQTARTVERAELLSTAGRGELASRLVYSLASRAMGAGACFCWWTEE